MTTAIPRMTWVGLALATLGWILLLANTALGPFEAAGGSLAAAAVLRADLVTIAEMLIVSGFATAILGALRDGFGVLHRFFDSVLNRANGPRPASPMPYNSPGVAPATATTDPAQEPTVEVPKAPKPKPPRDKNYTILDNGAVEVETLLGTRVFASLDEARDYLR